VRGGAGREPPTTGRGLAGPYLERRAAAAAADERVARISAAVRYLADHLASSSSRTSRW